MNTKLLIIAGAALVILLLVAAAIFFGVRLRRHKRKTKPLKVSYYTEQWRQLQKGLRSKKNWPTALIAADSLLSEALKKRGYRGRSIGEQIMKAQRVLTDNDGVWFGHKLRGKVESDPAFELTEKEIKQALIGLRQALKDLGALK